MYIKDTWLHLCLRDSITWTGGAYGAHRLKSFREDQVLGYDALSLHDTCV